MTTTAKAKPSKAAGEFAGAFDAFQMNVPSLEVPAIFRDSAEKAVSQAKDAYARMRAAAEEAGDVAEETYETARGHAVAVSLKALEMSKSSADASFAFAKDVVGAKTIADAFELQTAFFKKQFDSFTTQMKDFQDIAQKAAVEVSKPTRTALEKAFKDYKVA
jgi:phasin